ncbi:MAG TPA: hypothetical protein VE153_11925 [Myxococcus sp.]|nr:hypothetical protein [Myxococcus sp.]
MVGGHSLDPQLAALYARYGRGYFASDIYFLRVDDSENELETQTAWWRETWQSHVAVPLFIFGGVASLAYYFATVPGLSDAQGHQPVVQVDTYALDGLYALPIASSVDRFFDTYARYLELAGADPGFQEYGFSVLAFPWGVPHVVGRDERLVQLIREGRFDPLMPDAESRAWAAKVLATCPVSSPGG